MAENLKFSWVRLTLGISFLILIVSFFNIGRYKTESVIESDIIQYYGYLPATFIYGDVSMKFAQGDSVLGNRFWGKTAKNGGRVQKYTMGMAYAYAPFFLVGHIWAKVSDTHPADGFSLPYRFMIQLSSIFYTLLGLYFLSRILVRVWSSRIVSLTLLTILFGTNLYYYTTTAAAMSHAYLFCLVTMFIYFSIRFVKKPTLGMALLMGLMGGWVVLIRPTQLIIWLFPLLYGIYNKDHIRDRVQLLIDHWRKVAWIPVMILLVCLPQLFYWKYMTGSWLYYSYRDQGFFWTDPRVVEVMFSWRKGWLLYTPVMILSLIGIWFLRKEAKSYLLAVVAILLTGIYVISSWWCWWYGGSFGMRPMIDYYGLLGIPLCAFYYRFGRKVPSGKILAWVMAGVFIVFNLVQTLQARYNIIHYDSMTGEAYVASFLKLKRPPGYDDLLKAPDYDGALRGKRGVRYSPLEDFPP
ncbi:MAG: hypothetical protein H6581_10350 [Bacteroidia bacterium]|nr:hypothetical protein [Bacteroidia bacterium]